MTSAEKNLSEATEDPLRTLISKHSENLQEQEQRKQALARLKEALSSSPWHQAQAEKDGELFWQRLYDKAPLTYR